jgi:pSer/pThr/pTyr-binding forkhead associated (FHA) protein
VASQDDRELTTTLRIGSQPEVSATESPLLEGYLSAASDDEKVVLEEIINGSLEKAMLIIFKGPAKGSRYLITRKGATIGRSHESEIFLDDVTVSRSHAVIAFDERKMCFAIADRSSLNGTYINGSVVEKVSLSHGDQVQIGKFHLLFITGQK